MALKDISVGSESNTLNISVTTENQRSTSVTDSISLNITTDNPDGSTIQEGQTVEITTSPYSERTVDYEYVVNQGQDGADVEVCAEEV